MSYEDVYDQVISEYRKTGSVRRTARNVGTTLVRAQRILITEGLWSSETSRHVGKLYAEGKSVEQIAAELFVSPKTVQAYLPYTRNLQGYGGDDRSEDALRAEKYRRRMHDAAVRQVDKGVFLEETAQSAGTRQNHEAPELPFGAENTACIGNNEAGRSVNACNKGNCNMNKVHGAKAEPEEGSRMSDIPHNGFRDTYEAYRFRFPCVLRLSLELNISNIKAEDMQILNEYGKVKRGITRDVLVPADITLHALHYLIMRAFGWENSHLHHFLLPGEIFNLMTGSKDGPDRYGFTEKTGSVLRWTDLCGIYFRFPSEDYDDIYWDDDYIEGVSFKTWLRRKYTGPYSYGGYGEHYKNAHYEAEQYVKSWSSNELRSKKVADIEPGFTGSVDELLERLKVRDILIPEGIGSPADLEEQILKLVQHYKEERDQKRCGIIPVTHELVYRYDYGDGWEVRIRLEDYYYTGIYKDELTETGCDLNASKNGEHSASKQPGTIICDKHDADQNPLISEQVMKVKEKRRPVCIALDGLSLLDDVGGVFGYTNFLQKIHGEEKEEAEEYREWARGMGWTGRMNRPETLL